MNKLFFLLISFLLLPARQAVLTAAPLDYPMKEWTQDADDPVMKGYRSMLNREYPAALSWFRQALETESGNPAPDESRLSYIFSSLGVCYKNLWQFEDALDMYRQALDLTIRHAGSRSEPVAALYNNIGNLLNLTGELEEASMYFRNALDIYQGLPRPSVLNESRVLNNLGQNAFNRGAYIEARAYLLRSIEKRKQAGESNLGLPYHTLANTLVRLGKEKEADQYYQLSIKQLSALTQPAYRDLVQVYLSYGLFLTDQADQPDQGKEIYRRALELSRRHLGEQDPATAQVWNNLAGTYAFEEKYDTALFYYQHALVSISEHFSDLDPSTNPVGNEVLHLGRYISILSRKAETLCSWARKTGRLEHYVLGLNTYELAIEGIEKLRNQYQTEESKLFLADNALRTFHGAILAGLDLYERSGKEEYLYRAWVFAERSKASVLLSSLQNMEALETGGVPDALRQTELGLKREIARNEELLYEEEKRNDPDPDYVSRQKEIILDLVRQQDSLIDDMEIRYPEYYQLKYGHEIPTIPEIQQILSRREVILEYVMTGDRLVTFCISKKGVSYHNRYLDQAFRDAFMDVHGLLTAKNFNQDVRRDFLSFARSSNLLYQALVEPFIQEIHHRDLIIVADNKLNFLPFGILLTDTPDIKNTDYHHLPYLLATHNISYVNSAMLLHKVHRKERGINNRLIAYAPVYAGTGDSLPAGIRTRQYYRDRLLPIPGAAEEVSRIGQMLKGDVVLGEEATEAHFKQHAGSYDLIHLAMHTVIDDQNPMFSKLVFTESPAGNEDGLLNTFEIYNLRLNARLAVLSSCNSGIGELREGEGLISLARGFVYAGCPSLVISLWEVEDLASADLMEHFYAGLRKGRSKAAALREAKLHYLHESDQLHAHPYFWSGYIVMGDPGPVYYPVRLLAGLAGLAILLLLLFIFRRKIIPRGRKDRP